MLYYRPVSTNKISQRFGENLVPLYKQLGLLGHNGIDFGVHNEKVYWYGSGKGEVEAVKNDYLGGIGLYIITEEDGHYFRHRFWHLKESKVQVGQVAESGDLIAISDNTGAGTTGSHLHALDIKEVIRDSLGNWQSINKDNGYGGSIDPTPKFKNIFIGDYQNNLKGQIDILGKLIELWKRLLKVDK
jgi:murein DD-endopeptidase MepM/ murein hydrolase activator NlpD